MPIQRPSERVPRPSALDVFTDREELIAAFERNLVHKKPDEHRVLVFYGDGGIGKTTLLQKLEQLHRQRCPQALMGRLDMAGADTALPDLLLYRLRRLFPGIPFPSFTLALAEYGRRFHPEQVYGSDRKELLQGAGPYADALAGALEVLANLSGVGAAINAMKAAATAQRQLSDWVQRRAEPWLQRSQSLSEEQMFAQLPLQWARDFRQAISSHQGQSLDNPIPSSSTPPLIILDTYETLWHPGMAKSGRQREPREQWLVDLVSEMPEVLWVIAGRDRLSWEDAYDQGWSDFFEQHLVGQLSEEDARRFLAKRGVQEPPIVEKIVLQAAGVPFYLELESQLYDRTPADKRTPDVFGGTHQQLIDRFLTYLDASERSTLRLMAAFSIWDQELFRQVVSAFATGYPATGASELGKFWSIEPIGQRRWQLHNEMALHLQAYDLIQNTSQYYEVHHWGFKYFDTLLKSANERSDKANAPEWLQYGLKHACVIKTPIEWVNWFKDRLEELGAGRKSPALLGLVEQSIQQIKETSGTSSEEMAILLQRRAFFLRALADYTEAEESLKSCISILRSKYSPDHLRVVTPLNSLAGLMRLLSRYEESFELYQESMRIQTINDANSSWQYAKTLNDYALLLANDRNYSEAEKYYLKSLELKERIKGSSSRSVAVTLNNLAVMLRATERHEESLAHFERALEIKEAYYGEDNISISNTLNNMGILYTKVKRYAEAEECLVRALNIRIHAYGIDHPIVAKSQTSLAKLLYQTSRLFEAENLFRQSLITKEACLGINHASVIETLEGLADLLSERGAEEEAVVLRRRVLAIARTVYGLADWYTLSVLERMVKLLLSRGHALEANALLDDQIGLLRNQGQIDSSMIEKLEALKKVD
jgi:tetratricopeptide (TPR) repeat protein